MDIQATVNLKKRTGQLFVFVQLLPIAMDDNFEKFIEFCDMYLHNAVRKFLERVRKRYNECDEAFKESSDLLDKIVYTKEKIDRDDLRFFAHLREFYNVLKDNRKEELENRKQAKETKTLKRCLEHSEVVDITNDSKRRMTSQMETVVAPVKHENEYEGALQPSCVSGENTGQVVCSIFPDGTDDVAQEDEKHGAKGIVINASDTTDTDKEEESHGVKCKLNNKIDIDTDHEDENLGVKCKINNKIDIDTDHEDENLGVKCKIINKRREKRLGKKLSATASQRVVTHNGDSKIRFESHFKRSNGANSKHGSKAFKRVAGGLNSDSSSSDFEDNCNRSFTGSKKRNKSYSNNFNASLNSQSFQNSSQKGRGASISNRQRRKGGSKKRRFNNKIPLLIVTDNESDSDFDYTQSTQRKWWKKN